MVRRSKINLVKGMKDILPDEQHYWNLIKERVDKIAFVYGFSRLDTPLVEYTDLFKRTVGEETDIVNKEMYSFTTKGGHKLSLRPESTASIVRSYIEHGMLNLPQPVKLYYFGQQFRHDKPQKGRYRQFWQFGFEALGDNDPIIDAQLIAISYFILQELGLDIEIQINSIGDEESRKKYLKVLKQYYNLQKNKLCAACQKRLVKNTLRLLDCKNYKCQELTEKAPQILDYLNEESRDNFMMVLEYLDELDIVYNLNTKIVRGLDYYNKTAWEIGEKGQGGKLLAFGGGGRYDGLASLLGGRETPAVGFAIGVERVIMALHKNKIEIPKIEKPDIYVAQLGLEARKKALKIFEYLRKEDFKAIENMSKKGLRDQLDIAHRKGVKYTLILGQKEINDNTVLIRDMESGVQEIIDINKVKKEIEKRLAKSITKSIILKTKKKKKIVKKKTKKKKK